MNATMALGLLILPLGGCGASAVEGQYQLRAESAAVSPTNTLDHCRVGGGMPPCPDPTTYVCVTTPQSPIAACTTSQTGLAPQWFETLVASISTSQLQAGLSVELKQGTGAANDASLCKRNITVDTTALVASSFTVPCTNKDSIVFGLQAVNK